MDALLIVSTYDEIKEYLFSYTTQDYSDFMNVISSLGYMYKFILSTEKCMNLKYVHKSKYPELGKVSMQIAENKQLALCKASIPQKYVNGHPIKYIFRASITCTLCRKECAVFKKSRLCLFEPCTKSYNLFILGKDLLLY